VSDLDQRIALLRGRIERAAGRAGRSADDVRLLGVSKTFPTARVIEAAAAGLHCFGENRVQEAAQKIPAVNAARAERIEWHLVGALQRNKARRAAELFDVVQSVDRLALAEQLDRCAREHNRTLRVLVQVDIDAEPQKGGVAPAELPALLDALAGLTHLDVEGLMAIPAVHADPEAQRPAFARLRELLEAAQRSAPQGAQLRELSMGMSADFEVAIEEGSTCVRIGTALFGARADGERP
jgi:PLP dependent protein